MPTFRRDRDNPSFAMHEWSLDAGDTPTSKTIKAVMLRSRVSGACASMLLLTTRHHVSVAFGVCGCPTGFVGP